ncbi:type III secretion protein [Caballeronia pedi]|uniref:Type III secretion protein n=1 Tax=Caballeronia pedi TaxID=1777141 RepID=A0A158C0I6_9BURK|nr:flagellar biosynthetic protein FliQ [Caballeronia pedi]SAK75781.1 type III secretion protein [Caballeronia pedi]
MSADQALQFMAQMMWAGLVIAGPVLAACLIVGLTVSVFQVVTQLQEMSLSYVPKLAVVAIVLAVMAPWMLSRLARFATSLYTFIPSLG